MTPNAVFRKRRRALNRAAGLCACGRKPIRERRMCRRCSAMTRRNAARFAALNPGYFEEDRLLRQMI